MMKRFLLVLLLLSGTIVAGAQKKMLLGGSGWNEIVLVDKASKVVEWRHVLDSGTECNCVEYIKRKGVLYAYRKGARLVKMNGERVWDYTVGQGEELHTASLLPDGGYLLAIAGKPARIVELDKKGELKKEFLFNTGIESVHGQFRQVRKSKRGTYLLPLMARRCVVEVDGEGALLKTYPAEGNVFAVRELKDGNLLISCGDAHSFLVVDRESGQVIKRTGQDDIEGVSLQFVAEIALWKESVFITNWAGHSKVKDEPAVIEVDKDGKVVWTLAGYKSVSAITLIK